MDSITLEVFDKWPVPFFRIMTLFIISKNTLLFKQTIDKHLSDLDLFFPRQKLT